MLSPRKKGSKIPLHIKNQIIDCLASGMTPAEAARLHGLTGSTVRNIKYRELAKLSSGRLSMNDDNYELADDEPNVLPKLNKVDVSDDGSENHSDYDNVEEPVGKKQRLDVPSSSNSFQLHTIAGNSEAYEDDDIPTKKRETKFNIPLRKKVDNGLSSQTNTLQATLEKKEPKDNVAYEEEGEEEEEFFDNSDSGSSLWKPTVMTKKKKKLKKKYKPISLQTKIDILDSLASGESSSATGRRFGIYDNTVRYIKKTEAKIRNLYEITMKTRGTADLSARTHNGSDSEEVDDGYTNADGDNDFPPHSNTLKELEDGEEATGIDSVCEIKSEREEIYSDNEMDDIEFNENCSNDQEEDSMNVPSNNEESDDEEDNSIRRQKKKYKEIPLATKVKVLDSLASGISKAAAARVFDLNICTVRCIKKNETTIRNSQNKIRDVLESSSFKSVKVLHWPDSDDKSNKPISLQTKIEILDYLATGQNVCTVAGRFCCSETSVRKIKKNETAIRKAFQNVLKFSSPTILKGNGIAEKKDEEEKMEEDKNISSDSDHSRVKNSISLQAKIAILNCLASGQSVSATGRLFGVHDDSVRYIKKNEPKIRKLYKALKENGDSASLASRALNNNDNDNEEVGAKADKEQVSLSRKSTKANRSINDVFDEKELDEHEHEQDENNEEENIASGGESPQLDPVEVIYWQEEQDKLKNTISLQTTFDVLNCLANGNGTRAVAKAFDLNESTIKRIKKNEFNIRQLYDEKLIEKKENTIFYQKQRKTIYLETKIAILDYLATGNNLTEAACHFDLSESTIRSIRSNEAAIRDAYKVWLISNPSLTFSNRAKAITSGSHEKQLEDNEEKSGRSNDEYIPEIKSESVDISSDGEITQTTTIPIEAVYFPEQYNDKIFAEESSPNVENTKIAQPGLSNLSESRTIDSFWQQLNEPTNSDEDDYSTPDNSFKTLQNGHQDTQNSRRKKKEINLETKIKILDSLAAGNGASAIGRTYGVLESTVRYIKKTEARIRYLHKLMRKNGTSSNIQYNDDEQAEMEEEDEDDNEEIESKICLDSDKIVSSTSAHKTSNTSWQSNMEQPINHRNSNMEEPMALLYPYTHCRPNDPFSGRKTYARLYLTNKIEVLDCLATGQTVLDVAIRFGCSTTTVRLIKKNETAIRTLYRDGLKPNGTQTNTMQTVFDEKELNDNQAEGEEEINEDESIQIKSECVDLSTDNEMIEESLVNNVSSEEYVTECSPNAQPSSSSILSQLNTIEDACEEAKKLTSDEEDVLSDEVDSDEKNSFLKKSKKKRSRKTIYLETKVKILDCLASGLGSTTVSRLFGLHESTVRTIQKNEEAIRESYKFAINKHSHSNATYRSKKVHAALCSKEPNDNDEPEKESNYEPDKLPKKKIIDLDTKLEVLGRLATGQTLMSVALHFGFSKSSVSSIKRNYNSIMSSIRKLNRMIKAKGSFSLSLFELNFTETGERSKKTRWLRKFFMRRSLLPNTKSIKESKTYDLLERKINEFIEGAINTDDSISEDAIKIGLTMAKKLSDHIAENDPNKERAEKFQHDLNLLMAPYKDMSSFPNEISTDSSDCD